MVKMEHNYCCKVNVDADIMQRLPFCSNGGFMFFKKNDNNLILVSLLTIFFLLISCQHQIQKSPQATENNIQVNQANAANNDTQISSATDLATTNTQNLLGKEELKFTIRNEKGKKIADNGYISYEITGNPEKDAQALKAAKESLLKTNPEKYREMILHDPVLKPEENKGGVANKPNQ
jgi:hypothetical protein